MHRSIDLTYGLIGKFVWLKSDVTKNLATYSQSKKSRTLSNFKDRRVAERMVSYITKKFLLGALQFGIFAFFLGPTCVYIQRLIKSFVIAVLYHKRVCLEMFHKDGWRAKFGATPNIQLGNSFFRTNFDRNGYVSNFLVVPLVDNSTIWYMKVSKLNIVDWRRHYCRIHICMPWG